MQSFNSKMILVLLVVLFALGTFSLMPKNKTAQSTEQIKIEQTENTENVDQETDDSEKFDKEES